MELLNKDSLESYERYLTDAEKSGNTVAKYMRDIRAFYAFINGKTLSKSAVVEYKAQLAERYKANSANSMLAAVNGWLRFLGHSDCCVKQLKRQRRMFREERRELTRTEYERLCAAAKERGQERLMLCMETICATGIRVSELRYITIEAVKRRQTEIVCKGKRRIVFIPKALCKILMSYANAQKIRSGVIFKTKSGRLLDRSNIWHDMKALCEAARVERNKVFPHNLRHLFARTFYSIEKDIVRLADILGHSSVETTRIYTISSGAEHARKVERLGLII